MLAGLGYPGMLGPWLEATAAWTEVTLLDLPGWRSRRAVSCQPSIDGMAAAVSLWLRHTDGSRVVLIGHSTGAQVALRTAYDVPERLVGVVLAGPTIDAAARTWPRLIGRYLRPLWREHPAELPAVAGSMTASGVRPIVKLLRSALADRPEQQIGDLRVPALIITGHRDGVASPSWSSQLAQLAAAPWRILPGGHNSCFPNAELADAYVHEAVTGW